MSALTIINLVESPYERIAALEAQVRGLQAELIAERAGRQAEKDAFEIRIASLLHLQFGKKTEKKRRSTPVPAPGAPVSGLTLRQQAEERRAARKSLKNAKKGRGADQQKKRVNGGGRRQVNPRLEPKEEIILVPAHLRTLPDGTALVFKQWETTRREFNLPGKVICLVIKREILCTPDTGEKVITAPIPPSIVPRSKYHDSMIIETMVRKYWTGTPFGRIVQDMQALGSDLNDAVLSDFLFRFASFLSPIILAIRIQVLAALDICMDETPLPTQDGSCYLWAILGEKQVFFHAGRRTSDELRIILGNQPKIAIGEQATPSPKRALAIVHCMTDAFAGYDRPLTELGIIRMLCWAHARRNFKPFEKDDPVIAGVLSEIGILFGIEKQAKQEVAAGQLVGEAADAVYGRLRVELSQPQLAKIHVQLSELRGRYAEGTAQRNAFDYLLTKWDCFTRYAEHGHLPIDNNDCERALRPIVIGRKNWMQIGSEDAAQPAADLYTVMESCRLCHVDPRRYLPFVVQALHAGRTDFAALTPLSLASMFPLRE